MVDDGILTMLKIDLQISTEKMDMYLRHLISAAKTYIEAEGIRLDASTGDGMLVEMYAAYLYRRRREENVAMPRMLRWALNNRLFSQKSQAEGGEQSG